MSYKRAIDTDFIDLVHTAHRIRQHYGDRPAILELCAIIDRMVLREEKSKREKD